MNDPKCVISALDRCRVRLVESREGKRIVTHSARLAPESPMRVCFRCGCTIPGDQRVLRKDECPSCRQDLHCCRQCRFYDPGLSNQCAEPQVELVLDKERANFCDFFRIAEEGGSTSRASKESSTAREAWSKLFKES